MNEYSLLYAQIFGIYLTVIGLSIFTQPHQLRNAVKSFKKIEGLMLLAGAFGTLLGSYVVLTHNIWQANWSVIVTAIGWIIFIKGIVSLLSPKTQLRIANEVTDSTWLNLWGVVAIVFGLVLLYHGFVA